MEKKRDSQQEIIQKSVCENLGMDVKTRATTFDYHLNSMEN